MKYVLLAILMIFSFNTSADGVMTESEALNEMQTEMDNLYKNPPAPETAEEYHKANIEMLSKATQKGPYTGSGVELSDKDVYIDGKKYHCIEYELNTQCQHWQVVTSLRNSLKLLKGEHLKRCFFYA